MPRMLGSWTRRAIGRVPHAPGPPYLKGDPDFGRLPYASRGRLYSEDRLTTSNPQRS